MNGYAAPALVLVPVSVSELLDRFCELDRLREGQRYSLDRYFHFSHVLCSFSIV